MDNGLLLPPDQFALHHFGQTDLGDKRRGTRLVSIATAMTLRPDASIPQQMQDQHQAKAAYRFFSRSDLVTFDSLTDQHHGLTRSAMNQCRRVILIGDVSAADYTGHPATRGKELIGKGVLGGFSLYSVLAVDEQRQILGLAHQELFYRQQVPAKETRRQRLERQRQSHVWPAGVRALGCPPPGQQWIHVCDAESDTFEFYQACQACGSDLISRAGQDRRAALDHAALEPTGKLKGLLRSLEPVAGRWVWIHPQRKKKQKPRKGRWAKVHISYSPVTLFAPWLQPDQPPVKLWAVHVREVDAPPGVKAVEWFVLSTLELDSTEAALEVLDYYLWRVLIEEFHQCLKSGCALEQRQLALSDRLEAYAGLASVVAVRLLALKQQVKLEPQAPAIEHVQPLAVKLLVAARNLAVAPEHLTLHQFWRELAKLGGFLGRKSDGQPGWKTLWRGWRELELMLIGARVVLEPKSCG